jgi:hypothetical protein
MKRFTPVFEIGGGFGPAEPSLFAEENPVSQNKKAAGDRPL